jgi:hypothetical protein
MEPETMETETSPTIEARLAPVETSWKIIAQDLGRYVGYYLITTALLSLLIYLS